MKTPEIASLDSRDVSAIAELESKINAHRDGQRIVLIAYEYEGKTERHQ